MPKVRVFKRRGKWHIDYRPEGGYGKRIVRVMPDRQTARIIAKKIEVQLAEGTYLDRAKTARTTFATMAKRYLELSKATKRSWKRDRTSLRALGTVFDAQRLDDISSREVEQYKARRLAEVSPQSVRHELQCLRHLFSKAIEWGDATRNPAAAVKKPAARNTRVRYLSPEEEANLLAELAPHLVPIVTVAIYTGLRESEVLGLRWADVDFDNDVVHVEQTKNDSRRSVPVPKVAMRVLRKAPRHIRSPFVFCKASGDRYGRVDKGVRGACQRAGLTGVVFHTFRHTYASRLAMAGVGPQTMMELLGHSSYAMVQRYSHLSPEHRQRAVSVLDSYAVAQTDDVSYSGKEGEG